MSLLQFELNQINASFDEQWLCWQERAAIKTRYSTAENDNFWNFFPLNLYEYFADASFYAARRIALAARAGGMYGFLLQKQPTHDWSETETRAAAEWLMDFARAQLTPLIAADNPFWQQFTSSFDQCGRGFAHERQRLTLPAAPYSPTALADVITDKTALACLTTLAFATLTGQLPVAAAVCASQRELYAGIYLFQSVLNWKTDYHQQIYSYPLLNLLAEIPHLTADIAAESTQIGRYFYYTGQAEQTLAQASTHFYEAMAAVSDLSPTLWGALLTHFLEKTESLRKDIARIVQQHKARQQPAAPAPAKEIAAPPSSRLNQAIHAAAQYLASNQASDGRWGDFMLLAEQSSFWVTGYVGWTLSQLPKPVGRLEQAGRPELLGTTFEFLHYFGAKSLGDLPALPERDESAAT